ncbi:MAG: gluconate 2-dehydrogenase subunit 3 family protein [Alphaproteobacteria bacterium]|nr:gluconate 2-dehydrogenase subunit 3 family protein [Alphaproteobacteria bacterium]
MTQSGDGGADKSEGLKLCRRRFLASVAVLAIPGAPALARSYSGIKPPFFPFGADPPRPINPAGWYFLKPNEVAMVEAIVDRFIPADHLSPGGKDAGCAVFIDRQLAGSYGASSRLYMKGPFMPGLATQGYQGELTPAGRYRLGLARLSDYIRAHYAGKEFAALSHAQQDDVLAGLESGKIELKLVPGFSARAFFELMLQNTMEGFFADPLYGGNRGMVAWKMIGFPGARYDYRDYVEKHNQPYPHGPVSIYGEHG